MLTVGKSQEGQRKTDKINKNAYLFSKHFVGNTCEYIQAFEVEETIKELVMKVLEDFQTKRPATLAIHSFSLLAYVNCTK
jgi:hypothetical protein